MNYLSILWLILMLCVSPLFAKGAPITIGIMKLNPPFAVQMSKDEVYGFDIDMMNSLCKIMERKCTYKFVYLKDLIPFVANGTVDISVSSITINAERARIVNFSIPYMVSYTRFLAQRNANPPAFSLEALSGKAIAVKKGDIFRKELESLGITNVKIKEYLNTAEELQALNSGEVNYVILDDAVAHYWSTSYSKEFMLAGPAYQYGNGFAIAVNPKDPVLLADIDKALRIYQDSEDYKNNYDKFIKRFDK